MAGAGYKLFNTGDVLTAQEVNEYLMQQTVMVFANAAARTTALSGIVAEGMISYLKDTNAVEVYNGSSWVASDDPNAIQNTIVDAKGDLITATAADTPARLAVGTNGQVLIADSTQSTGLRWGSVGGQLTETVFNASNASWSIPSGVTGIWALVVGGGGGGGASATATASNGGGGGGGGQVVEKFFTVAGDTTLNITVGAGGAGGATSGALGSNGSTSSIVGNTSATTYASAIGGGGGGGGATGNTTALTGASAGGQGSTSSNTAIGAGGGFSESAVSHATGISNGTWSSTTPPNVGRGQQPTTVGVTGSYGGGAIDSVSRGGKGILIWGRALAGGGNSSATTDGLGISFGGAQSAGIDVTANAGTANTGGGGSPGRTGTSTLRAGGAGGSGVVILRYSA